jgi:glycosyltransferase involved in cell wall biosynthesis
MVSSAIGSRYGVARYIENLTKGLRDDGYKVKLVRPLIRSGIEPLRRTLYNFQCMFSKIDKNAIIHAHTFDGFLIKRACAAYVTTLHGIMADESKYLRSSRARIPQAIYAPLEGQNCRRADRCTTVSEYSKKRAVELYNLDSSKVDVVPPCTNLSHFRPAKSEFKKDRSILFVGHIHRRKGLDILLRALQLIKRDEVRLRVIGNGPDLSYTMLLTDQLGLSNQVQFLGDVSENDLVSYYQTSSVLCVPSLHEAFGQVAVEAQACGRPVVASRTGGLAEAVACKDLLVPPGDPDALAKVLQIVFERDYDPHRLREFVVRNYSPEVIIPRMEAAYLRAKSDRRLPQSYL